MAHGSKDAESLWEHVCPKGSSAGECLRYHAGLSTPEEALKYGKQGGKNTQLRGKAINMALCKAGNTEYCPEGYTPPEE